MAGYGRPTGIPVVEDVAADYLGLPTDAERDRLYRNRGNGTFEDVTKAAGLNKVLAAMALNYGDLDNDGWLDFYAGTGTPDLGMLVPNRMFRNDAGKRFQEVTTAGNFGHLQKGHAIAFGDVDNDGDQDVFEQMGGAYLGDRRGARSIGTLARPTPGWASSSRASARTGAASASGSIWRWRRRAVCDTSIAPSAVAAASAATRCGRRLGSARRAASSGSRSLWPATGLKQRVTGLAPGRRYRIREGAEKAEEVVWPASARARTRAAATELVGNPVRQRHGHQARDDEGAVLGPVAAGADDEPAGFRVHHEDADRDLHAKPEGERAGPQPEAECDASDDLHDRECPGDGRAGRKARAGQEGAETADGPQSDSSHAVNDENRRDGSSQEGDADAGLAVVAGQGHFS